MAASRLTTPLFIASMICAALYCGKARSKTNGAGAMSLARMAESIRAGSSIGAGRL